MWREWLNSQEWEWHNKNDSINSILQHVRAVDKNCCVVFPTSGFPDLTLCPRQCKWEVATTLLNDDDKIVITNKFQWKYLNKVKTKLIFWSTCPTDPTLSINNFCFLKKKETKHNKYINNQNQEAFIVTIIIIHLALFFCVYFFKIIFLKKILARRIKYYFYFANRLTLFFAAFPVDQKNWLGLI